MKLVSSFNQKFVETLSSSTQLLVSFNKPLCDLRGALTTSLKGDSTVASDDDTKIGSKATPYSTLFYLMFSACNRAEKRENNNSVPKGLQLGYFYKEFYACKYSGDIFKRIKSSNFTKKLRKILAKFDETLYQYLKAHEKPYMAWK